MPCRPSVPRRSTACARSAIAKRTSGDVREGGLHRESIQHGIVAGVNCLCVVMEVSNHPPD